MEQSLKSLIVLLFIYAFSSYIYSRMLASKERQLLIASVKTGAAITVLAFIGLGFWPFLLASTFVLLLFFKSRDSRIAFLFFAMLLPGHVVPIPGFFGVAKLGYFSWALFVTLLFALLIWLDGVKVDFIASSVDRWVLVLAWMFFLLEMRDSNFTNGLRNGLLSFALIIAPYFVGRRIVTSQQDLIKFSELFVFLMFFMSLLGVFESLKGWPLYGVIRWAWDLPPEAISSFKLRGGILRASAAYGNIYLGLLIVFAIGFCILIKEEFKSAFSRRIVVAVLVFGSISTMSRGPWVGLFLFVAFYYFLSFGLSGGAKLLLVATASFFLLASVSPDLVGYLPYMGKQDDTIEYREMLFSQSMAEIKDHFLIGSLDFMSSPRMQVLIQGEGIIDLVNSYIEVTLRYGVLGLIFFFMPSLILFRFFYRAARAGHAQLTASVFGGLLIAVHFVIFTVSSIGNHMISVVYWAFMGLSVSVMVMRSDKFHDEKIS